jgi:hypothetical protein
MIRVLVEVGSGTDRFSVAVLAVSIEQAVSIAEAHYPGGEAQVVYPIEPEAFFVKARSTVRLIGVETTGLGYPTGTLP